MVASKGHFGKRGLHQWVTQAHHGNLIFWQEVSGEQKQVSFSVLEAGYVACCSEVLLSHQEKTMQQADKQTLLVFYILIFLST